MDVIDFVAYVVVVLVAYGAYKFFSAQSAHKSTKAEIAHALNTMFGPVNKKMTCPHCQATGFIRTRQTTEKKGVSGGKATAALLTGGISMLVVGLSRKEENTRAYCQNCENTWVF